jgi:hypothetical protein
MVGTVQHIDAPRVAGIGVEHLASLILAEDADPDFIRHRIRPNFVIVRRFALGDLLGRKRHVIVEIEIAFV